MLIQIILRIVTLKQSTIQVKAIFFGNLLNIQQTQNYLAHHGCTCNKHFNLRKAFVIILNKISLLVFLSVVCFTATYCHAKVRRNGFIIVMDAQNGSRLLFVKIPLIDIVCLFN